MNIPNPDIKLRLITTAKPKVVQLEPAAIKINTRLDLIQIFRGVAALIVVIHHISASSAFYFHYTLFGGIFKAGWNGVDFFFVLSGFIITYVHLKDLGQRKKLYNYACKRFIRIYPTYWVFASVALMFSVFANFLTLSNSSYILKSLLLIPHDTLPVLGVAWSLCFEVCFYLLFAFYIFTGYKGFIVGLLIHASFVLINAFFPALFVHVPVVSFLSNNYNLEFLIGCVVGVIFLKYRNIGINQYKYLLLSAGLGLFSLTWYLSLSNINFSRGSINCRLWYGIASGLLIFGGGLFKSVHHAKLSRLLLKIGDASYVLYLAHSLILAFAFKSFAFIVDKADFTINSTVLYSFSIAVFTLCIVFSLYYFSSIEKRIIRNLNNIFLKKKS